MKTPLLLLALAALGTSPAPAQEPPKPAPATVPAAKIVTTDEAQKLLKADPKIIILDVRTADEYQAGHLAGARNIDIMSPDFAQQIAALDKSQTYLIHCAAGGRSARACAVPAVQQLPSLYHMNEGYKGWEKSGKPIEKAAPAR